MLVTGSGDLPSLHPENRRRLYERSFLYGTVRGGNRDTCSQRLQKADSCLLLDRVWKLLLQNVCAQA